MYLLYKYIYFRVEQDPVVQIRRIVMPIPFPPRFPPQFQQPPQPPQPMNQFEPPMNYPPSPQNNFQPPQMRIPFPPQLPQMMSPPQQAVPQFRLINPAPHQELPNFVPPQQKQLPFFGRPQQQEVSQPEVRIQLRRIQVPGSIGEIFPFLNNIHNEASKELETPRQDVQQVPLEVALSKIGITPEDLKNIQRMAEEKFEQHIRELVSKKSVFLKLFCLMKLFCK